MQKGSWKRAGNFRPGRQEGEYNIYPILRNNIKVFLEIITEMERKIEKMKEKNFSKKEIQAVLENERLYDRIK